MGQAASTYLWEIVAESLSSEISPSVGNRATDWGHEHEPSARAYYSFTENLIVEEVGFVQHPDKPLFGCSPDGLVGDDGGLEIKCPYNTSKHLQNILISRVPDEYSWQIQGSLWITKRKWWDFVSFDPRLITEGLHYHRVRVEPDAEMQEALSQRAEQFEQEYHHHIETLNRRKLND